MKPLLFKQIIKSNYMSFRALIRFAPEWMPNSCDLCYDQWHFVEDLMNVWTPLKITNVWSRSKCIERTKANYSKRMVSRLEMICEVK